MYWATTNYGFFGYFAAALFWGGHTITRVFKIKLLLLQGCTFSVAAYSFWPAAARDAHATMITIGRFVSGQWAIILVTALAIVLFSGLYFIFGRVSGAVHDAALGFGQRISRLFSGRSQARAVCKEALLQHLGVDQFASFGGRTYIRVPYSDRNEAYRLGARWDGVRKSWYIPRGTDPRLFDHWRGE